MAENELALVIKELPVLDPSERQENVHARVREVVEKMGALRKSWQEMYDLLGPDWHREGKALRALVRAAKEELPRYITTPNCDLEHYAHGQARCSFWPEKAALVALLLARREQGEEPERQDNRDTLGRRHTLTEGGDCYDDCQACRENMRAGLNPDGTAPEVIHLSPEGQQQFAEALIGPIPPAPNLKRAVKHYKQVMGRDGAQVTCVQCTWCWPDDERQGERCGHDEAPEDSHVDEYGLLPKWCPGFEPRKDEP